MSILLGAKAPILEGAQMGSSDHPLHEGRSPLRQHQGNVIEPVWEWWMEEGKNRERLGELIQRQGIPEAHGSPEGPGHAAVRKEPRSNPYIFWKEEDVPGGWKRDINDYRSRHKR